MYVTYRLCMLCTVYVKEDVKEPDKSYPLNNDMQVFIVSLHCL